MHAYLSALLLMLAATMVMPGCGDGQHRVTVNLISGNERTADGDTGSGGPQSLPVEYVRAGEPRVVDAALHAAPEGLFLKGRLAARSFTKLQPSRVVRVEAFDDAHNLLWSATGKMDRDKASAWHRRRTGTFRVEVPTVDHVDHLHVGVVVKRHADEMLPGHVRRTTLDGMYEEKQICRL